MMQKLNLNHEKNQRMDQMEGLDPTEFGDIVMSVIKQAGKHVWPMPEFSKELLVMTAEVLQAAEYTKAGEEWIECNEIRMYSIPSILLVSSNDVEMESVIKIVVDALQDINGEYSKIAHLDKYSLHAALDCLSCTWLILDDATKESIRANARKVLHILADFNELGVK